MSEFQQEENMIHEFDAFKKLVETDPEYAWALHCNIAVPIMDHIRVSHATANQASAAVMMNLFGVDITNHPAYAYPNHDPRPTPLCGDMAEAVYGQPNT